MKIKELLAAGTKELGLELTSKQIDAFMNYLDILQEWNQKMNLTAIDDSEEIVIKHFLDSLSSVSVMDLAGDEKMIDLGTGAGFPGIPLKIFYPKLDLTLLDSTKKKITFLKKFS